MLEQENMTWDEFNVKCNGHLLSSEEAHGIRRTESTNIPPSVRFWVAERIWSYIHFGFGKHSCNSHVKVCCFIALEKNYPYLD